MIRFSAKYLDGIWRSSNYTIHSKSNYTIHSKEGEKEYAKELVEMFRHFMYKGNILGYTVEIVSHFGDKEFIDFKKSEEL